MIIGSATEENIECPAQRKSSNKTVFVPINIDNLAFFLIMTGSSIRINLMKAAAARLLLLLLTVLLAEYRLTTHTVDDSNKVMLLLIQLLSLLTEEIPFLVALLLVSERSMMKGEEERGASISIDCSLCCCRAFCFKPCIQVGVGSFSCW